MSGEMQEQTRKNSISVGMTTYNSEKYVVEQLESIFQQSVKPDEIVICDDKSSLNYSPRCGDCG